MGRRRRTHNVMMGGHQLAPRVGLYRNAAGMVVDGDLQLLEGEPPIATTRGWGDISWVRRRRSS